MAQSLWCPTLQMTALRVIPTRETRERSFQDVVGVRGVPFLLADPPLHTFSIHPTPPPPPFSLLSFLISPSLHVS